jgi:hypothetical protein
MKTIILSVFLFFVCNLSFGQFKHEHNANGDPLTEIMDPNGMKQGNWNFTDSQNRNFRTEHFKDNTLVSNLYKLSGAFVDVSSFKQSNISSFRQKAIQDLAASLATIGHGEIVILADNTAAIHVYVDKIKNASALSKVDVSVLKTYSLQKTIIFF